MPFQVALFSFIESEFERVISGIRSIKNRLEPAITITMKDRLNQVIG